MTARESLNNANTGLEDTSKFEDSENLLFQTDVNLGLSSTIPSQYLGLSSTFPSQFDNDVSKSYVISEENSTLYKYAEDVISTNPPEVATNTPEVDFNVSRSYVISDNKSELVDGNVVSREAIGDEVACKITTIDIVGDEEIVDDMIATPDKIQPEPEREHNEELGTLEDPLEVIQHDDDSNENIDNNLIDDVIDKWVNEDDTCEQLLGDDSGEESPPSLRSIKSIAEVKKKKLLENRRGEVIEDETKSNMKYKPEGSVDKNRYSTLTKLKENMRKDKGKQQSSNVPRRNGTLPKKPLNNVKTFNKKTKSDFGVKFKHSSTVKDDPLKTEVEQLQNLNERERRSNVKICENLTASQRKWKQERERLCTDYERKIEELNLKIVSCENKNEVILQHTGEVDGNLLPTVSADDIINLRKQLELQETMISGFQLENERLYNKVKHHDATMEAAISKLQLEKMELLESLETLRMKYNVDQEKLRKKLKWYAENQVLLDNDTNELERKREDTKNLRTLVERIEADAQKLRSENTELKEELCRNINAAAENSTQGFLLPAHSNVSTDPKLSPVLLPTIGKGEDSPVKERPMHTYLEKRIKTLEDELEEKDIQNARKMRAIEQKYSVLTMEYEENVKQLERKVIKLDDEKRQRESGEKDDELTKIKSEHSSALHELRQLIDVKEEEISILLVKLSEKSKKDEKNSKPALQKQVDTLKKKLKFKDAEINELTNSILLLEKDRRLLTDELQEDLAVKQLEYIPQAPVKTDTTSPRKDYTKLEEKHSALLDENKNFQQFVEELQIEGEEKRLHYQALEAKSQSEVRNLREKYEEEQQELNKKYERTIEKLKMEFAVDHSNSKVAELNGKVTGYELMIEHLKNTIDEVRIDRNKFIQMEVAKETLQKKISKLQQELQEAQSCDVPEIRHYKMLQAKINSMERNHYSREEKLQEIIESTKGKALAHLESVEEKYQEELQKKDIEIENFRLELDSIIEVLQELQKQGVILTKNDVTLPP